jgi:prepilin-type N-terminal cleavage/methylation domain-containing protein
MANTLALSNHGPAKSRKGFSLVELSVVVIIIGVLAAFGVPRLLQSVERSKASEAFNYLASVRTAQERFQARQGIFADDIADLDMSQTPPTYFDNPTVVAAGGTGDLETSWQLTLTRAGASSGFGAYTVTFNQDGFSPADSDIPATINPQGT